MNWDHIAIVFIYISFAQTVGWKWDEMWTYLATGNCHLDEGNNLETNATILAVMLFNTNFEGTIQSYSYASLFLLQTVAWKQRNAKRWKLSSWGTSTVIWNSILSHSLSFSLTYSILYYSLMPQKWMVCWMLQFIKKSANVDRSQ
jgi:hypothetical protein